jgi:hypothetical protein
MPRCFFFSDGIPLPAVNTTHKLKVWVLLDDSRELALAIPRLDDQLCARCLLLLLLLL